MSQPIISVEGLSKKFVISHESKAKYSSLRDEISSKMRGIVSCKPDRQISGKEEFFALRDVNFEVAQGDRVGIVGRNGAGKSTLLKVLSRITEPTAGRITIRGRVASLLEVGTGFHPELTGRENIFLNGAILGMNRSEIRQKFDEIVDFAEIERFLDTPVKKYSSGMYVRLAFAVAAHLEPEILIVDEVLAVGDAQFQKKCLGKMEDVSRNGGRTVLFVSHNMGVIVQLCNKAILLQKGTVIANGSANAVIDKYISSDSASDNVYVHAERPGDGKVNFFTKVVTVNSEGLACSDFSFDEPIILEFEFIVRDPVNNLQIGVALQDKFQNRVFTVLQPVSFFISEGDNRYRGRVRIPESTIAPNLYSFVFAIWTKSGDVFDLASGIVPVKIHDSGTDLAGYEGVDYGSIIINPVWENA